MNTSSVKMKWNLVGELTIYDIAYIAKNAFSDLLRWLRLILFMSWM